jgi:hypothetical protein
MRAPDEPDVDILIAEMVKTLGGDDTAKQNIGTTIVNLVMAGDEPLWGNRAGNIEYFSTLQKRVTQLLGTLRAAPAHTTYFVLFAPEDGETIDAMMQEALARQSELMTMLEELHARCGKNIDWAPGVHGSLGWRERQAAIEARLLWERHGRHPTLIEAFIEFAEQLFRAAWRGEPQDMRRACADALRSPIKTDV